MDVVQLDDRYIHSLTVGNRGLTLYDNNKNPITSLNENTDNDYQEGALHCDKKAKRIYWDDGQGNELWSFPDSIIAKGKGAKFQVSTEMKMITTLDPKTKYYIYNDATSQCLTYKRTITDYHYVYYSVTYDKCTNTPSSQWYIDGQYISSAVNNNCLAIVNKTGLGSAGRFQAITQAQYDRVFDIDIEKGTICSMGQCLKTGGGLPVDSSTNYDDHYQWSFLTELSSDLTRCGETYGKCGEGECCNSQGQCGATQEFCGTGCQSDYGVCEGDKCGEQSQTFCPHNYCCSKDGICGSSEAHCGTGCQSDYGKCL
ncbi:carbohydrate-binding module family 18 protein [Piromyces sp. E2]|nr:carbohydrate-binding module family 18 protein [Piromyces sp. E2]|eukprot:OUM63902.1 carbohydrate-binding module family 18 protein [Piromyces sp. E2]